MKKIFSLTLCALMATLLFVACSDKESDLGINLVDSATLYKGYTHTLYADDAWTELEDSLLTWSKTVNYSYGIIGNYSDPTFGKVSASLYTQIALAANTTDISFDDEVVFDSVVLSFAKLQLFPDTAASYNFHFEVKQLAEPVMNDSTYYSFSSLPVDDSKTFFDRTVRVNPTDDEVALTMDHSIFPVLNRTATAEQFLEEVKGLRVRITNAGDEGMLSVDFTSAKTCLTVYFHAIIGEDTTHSYYTFLMGSGSAHFAHFEHDYSGTIFNHRDKVPGNMRLYMEPMGGHMVRLSFDNAIKAFLDTVPMATIHYAELLMPVSAESMADGNLPDLLLTVGKDADGGEDNYVMDMRDPYTALGYDGAYHADSGYYRMRVTQHMQGLLRKGGDPGILLQLNSRRHAAQRATFYGLTSAKRPRINIIYSK